ncbi:MAG: hypothetical protein ACKO5E_17740 [bacterium]
MIIDMAAFTGPYERRPTKVPLPAGLAEKLEPWGVTQVFAGRINHLRQENTHAVDFPLKSFNRNGVEIHIVPVLDPTVATWREHLESYWTFHKASLPVIRLHPNYHGYRLSELKAMADLVQWAHDHGSVLQIVVNIDDIRRQHSLGQVPDVATADILNTALKYPHQPFLLSGALMTLMRPLKAESAPNLWVDTARLETGLALPILFDNGWAHRLVYASHSPILIAHSSIARVLADLSDTDAMKILNGNARRLLRLNP